MALTPQGRALADATNSALADLDAVCGSLLTRDQEVARVRVTTLHSLAYCWLIPRLPGFTATHPNVQLDFETSISLARFDDAGPDLGIRHGPGPWPGLTAHFLMDDALFPVAAPTLAGLRQVTNAAHIPRLPLISDLGLQGWPDWFRAADVRQASLPAAHSFTDSTDAMLAAVCGLGVALARRHIAAGRADSVAWADAQGTLLVLRRAPRASPPDTGRRGVHRLAAPRGRAGRRRNFRPRNSA